MRMTMSNEDYPFGYCTNVHAGVTLEAAKANLEQVAVTVRQQVAPAGALPVGLWLPHRAAAQLSTGDGVARFRDWLEDRKLRAYTFNGFPQGDFHQPVVKHDVYLPTWLEGVRADYTCLLADILAGLLPDGAAGSISTLPLGWPHAPWTDDDYRRAASNLRRVAAHLHGIAERSGHEIVLAIEPEPGCVLDTAPDIIGFLERFVFDSGLGDADLIRRYITVCHDVCHSAVMFEPQEQALAAYETHGIRVGKVQVSSAIEVPWQELSAEQVVGASQQLRSFSEPRYLHQTTRRIESDASCEMVDDLPQALENWLGEAFDRKVPWRIHFHVPIYIDRFGALRATRDDIAEVVGYLEQRKASRVADRAWFSGHYEVETYAWGVLPEELQSDNLAKGIADELKYFRELHR